jgi:hypothetical protein
MTKKLVSLIHSTVLNTTENTNEACSQTQLFNDTLHVSAVQHHQQVYSVQKFKKSSAFLTHNFSVSEVSLICDYIFVLYNIYKYIVLIYIYYIFILYNIYKYVVLIYIYILYNIYWARGGVVVRTLGYKPTGGGFDSRWWHWKFSVT